MTDYIGKTVFIIDNFGGHFFEIGDQVRITHVADFDHEYGQGYRAEYIDGSDYWYIYEEKGVRTEFSIVGDVQ